MKIMIGVIAALVLLAGVQQCQVRSATTKAAEAAAARDAAVAANTTLEKALEDEKAIYQREKEEREREAARQRELVARALQNESDARERAAQWETAYSEVVRNEDPASCIHQPVPNSILERLRIAQGSDGS